MRFVLTSMGFVEPSEGAIIPEIIKHMNPIYGAVEIGQRTSEIIAEQAVLTATEKIIMWMTHIGLPVLSEGLLVWAMFCLLMAVTGKGAWMERAVKSFIGFVMVGVASYAV